MSVIIRLQGLSWSASAMDIRNFFKGLNIPPGGVRIIGGEKGDAFIAFSTDEDARQAMMLNNTHLNDGPVQLFLSSKTEMQNTITQAKDAGVPVAPQTIAPPVTTPVLSQIPSVQQISQAFPAVGQLIDSLGLGQQSLQMNQFQSGFNGSSKPSSISASSGFMNTIPMTMQAAHKTALIDTNSKRFENELPGEYSVGGNQPPNRMKPNQPAQFGFGDHGSQFSMQPVNPMQMPNQQNPLQHRQQIGNLNQNTPMQRPPSHMSSIGRPSFPQNQMWDGNPNQRLNEMHDFNQNNPFQNRQHGIDLGHFQGPTKQLEPEPSIMQNTFQGTVFPPNSRPSSSSGGDASKLKHSRFNQVETSTKQMPVSTNTIITDQERPPVTNSSPAQKSSVSYSNKHNAPLSNVRDEFGRNIPVRELKANESKNSNRDEKSNEESVKDSNKRNSKDRERSSRHDSPRDRDRRDRSRRDNDDDRRYRRDRDRDRRRDRDNYRSDRDRNKDSKDEDRKSSPTSDSGRKARKRSLSPSSKNKNENEKKQVNRTDNVTSTNANKVNVTTTSSPKVGNSVSTNSGDVVRSRNIAPLFPVVTSSSSETLLGEAPSTSLVGNRVDDRNLRINRERRDFGSKELGSIPRISPFDPRKPESTFQNSGGQKEPVFANPKDNGRNFSEPQTFDYGHSIGGRPVIDSSSRDLSSSKQTGKRPQRAPLLGDPNIRSSYDDSEDHSVPLGPGGNMRSAWQDGPPDREGQSLGPQGSMGIPDRDGSTGRDRVFGPPGHNGRFGPPGRVGRDGPPGRDGSFEMPDDSRLPVGDGPIGFPDHDDPPGPDGHFCQPSRGGRLGPFGPLGKPGREASFNPPGHGGSFGPPGRDGSFGQPGRDGSFGQPSHDGSFGPPGRDGSFGPPGRDGSFGPPGRDGSFGPAGRDGSFGPAGRDGSFGPPGRDGSFGQPSRDGSFGPPGRDGSFGPPGRDGSFGPAGRDDAFGPPGRDGAFGLPGRDRPFGPPGRDGSFGPSGRDSHIGRGGKFGPPRLDGPPSRDGSLGPPDRDTLPGRDDPLGHDGLMGCDSTIAPHGGVGSFASRGRDGPRGRGRGFASSGYNGPPGPDKRFNPISRDGPPISEVQFSHNSRDVPLDHDGHFGRHEPSAKRIPGGSVNREGYLEPPRQDTHHGLPARNSLLGDPTHENPFMERPRDNFPGSRHDNLYLDDESGFRDQPYDGPFGKEDRSDFNPRQDHERMHSGSFRDLRNMEGPRDIRDQDRRQLNMEHIPPRSGSRVLLETPPGDEHGQGDRGNRFDDRQRNDGRFEVSSRENQRFDSRSYDDRRRNLDDDRGARGFRDRDQGDDSRHFSDRAQIDRDRERRSYGRVTPDTTDRNVNKFRNETLSRDRERNDSTSNRDRNERPDRESRTSRYRPSSGRNKDIDVLDNAVEGTTSSAEVDNACRTILLENIPVETSYKDIRRFFSSIEFHKDGIKLINDEEGKRIGKAYMKVATHESLKKALRLHRSKMGNKLIVVKPVSKNEFDSAIDSYLPPADPDGKDYSKDIDVCNSLSAALRVLKGESILPEKTDIQDLVIKLSSLSEYTKKSHVKRFFQGCEIGQTGEAIVIESGENKPCTGLCYVEFANQAAFQMALNRRRYIDNKPINITVGSKKDMNELKNRMMSFTAKNQNSQNDERENSDAQRENNSNENISDGTARKDGSKSASYVRDPNKRYLWLKNIPRNLKVSEMRSLFDGLGVNVRSVQVCHDAVDKPTGEGFVEFISHDDAAKGLAKDKTLVGSNKIAIELVSKADMVEHMRLLRVAVHPEQPTSQAVFYFVKASNLPKNVSIGDIMNFFSGFRPAPESIRLNIGDGEGSSESSTALVGFHNREDAETAISANNERKMRDRTVELAKVIV